MSKQTERKRRRIRKESEHRTTNFTTSPGAWKIFGERLAPHLSGGGRGLERAYHCRAIGRKRFFSDVTKTFVKETFLAWSSEGGKKGLKGEAIKDAASQSRSLRKSSQR